MTDQEKKDYLSGSDDLIESENETKTEQKISEPERKFLLRGEDIKSSLILEKY